MTNRIYTIPAREVVPGMIWVACHGHESLEICVADAVFP